MLTVQRENPMIGQLYDLLHLIWKTYNFSPKSRRELRAIGADLGVNVLMPSGVKGTRWLPHVSRALETFLKPGQFTAVYYHMDHLAGSSGNADIAGRAAKVSAILSEYFLHESHLSLIILGIEFMIVLLLFIVLFLLLYDAGHEINGRCHICCFLPFHQRCVQWH